MEAHRDSKAPRRRASRRYPIMITIGTNENAAATGGLTMELS
jgi:hypothetical protein